MKEEEKIEYIRQKIGENVKMGTIFIGFASLFEVEFDDFRMLFNSEWIDNYNKHANYWGYDRETEMLDVIVRAYNVIKGNPLDYEDLPMQIVSRIMVQDNLLKGIKIQFKEETLFGIQYSNVISQIKGNCPKIIYAANA